MPLTYTLNSHSSPPPRTHLWHTVLKRACPSPPLGPPPPKRRRLQVVVVVVAVGSRVKNGKMLSC